MALAKLTDYVKIVTSYTDTVNYGVIRLQMSNGIAKQKRTLLSPIKLINMGLMIQGNDNKKLFDTWYSDALQGGTGRFIYLDKTINKSYFARFAQHPIVWNYAGVSEIWTTTATIEFRDV